MLHTAEDTIQHERQENIGPKTSPTTTTTTNSHLLGSLQQNNLDQTDRQQTHNNDKNISNDSSPSSPSPPPNNDGVLGDLNLPDTLEEFPMPGFQPRNPTPGRSTFSMTLQGNRQDDPPPEKKWQQQATFTSEIIRNKNYDGPTIRSSERYSSPYYDPRTLLSSDVSNTAGGDQDVSFDSGKDVSISLASSVSSEASSKELGEESMADIAKQHSLRKNLYNRDYETQKAPETKKWSVTLDPFSPKAEIVNRQNKNNDKVSYHHA